MSVASHVELSPLDHHSLLHGVWRLADPKIALASLVPFGVGAVFAWQATRTINAELAVAAFLAIFLVEVGKNAVNDLYDFRSGADTAVRPEERSPFSGGKRVLVDGLLTEHDLVVTAWIAFALAGVIGAAVALASQPLLLFLGAGAALISILYAMPPLHLAYRGLGELAVLMVYGPGILLGTIVLLRGTIDGQAIAAAIMIGILIALVLLANELPDERADGMAGKRTLVVRLGRDRATALINVLFVAAFVIPIAFAAYRGATALSGALVGIPVAMFAFRSFEQEPIGPPIVGQTATLVTYVVTGVGVAAGAMVF